MLLMHLFKPVLQSSVRQMSFTMVFITHDATKSVKFKQYIVIDNSGKLDSHNSPITCPVKCLSRIRLGAKRAYK